ncbi:MAG: polyribonucleotide nucleotidyltransferase [Planctomycetota bacterium]
MIHKQERTIGGKVLSIEVGRLARQADGAALVRYADTMVLAAACSGTPREGTDFFPLTIDYREKMSAAGKFPGSFFKREGRPTQKETLTMRLIDRPLRPLFPDSYFDEVQVASIVLSADPENNPDILAIVASSASLAVSSIPFGPPIGAIRVGHVNGEFVVNPTHEQLTRSSIDLVVAGTRHGICMVEAGAKEATEDLLVDALVFAEEPVREIAGMIEELAASCGKPKTEVPPAAVDPQLVTSVRKTYCDRYREANYVPEKLNRAAAMRAVVDEALAALVDESAPDAAQRRHSVVQVFHDLEYEIVRKGALEGRRCDGRGPDAIRPINCEIGLLPRSHGSALFTRGETQAVVSVTLGTSVNEQKVDGLLDDYYEAFMVHYNFPPWSVNEVKPIRGPGRREIGHGALAERALKPLLPTADVFPYTIRIVSDILESNGSSSMATVCGATLAIMDAGVPLQHPVAGIAMGLIREGDRYAVLSDILGSEDHCGDMDFKVAGTQKGVTALQMDIKISNVNVDILRKALQQAREGRLLILRAMLAVINKPRADISVYAPKIVRTRINPEKIGMLIGTGGKTIQGIEHDFEVTIEVEDDGTVTISAQKKDAADRARQYIDLMMQEVKVGETYEGRVTSVKDFGAFVEILPGQEGLCHISELAEGYVDKIGDVIRVGDTLRVKVLDIDDQNRIRLSRRAVLRDEAGHQKSS